MVDPVFIIFVTFRCAMQIDSRRLVLFDGSDLECREKGYVRVFDRLTVRSGAGDMARLVPDVRSTS